MKKSNPFLSKVCEGPVQVVPIAIRRETQSCRWLRSSMGAVDRWHRHRGADHRSTFDGGCDIHAVQRFAWCALV